MSVSSQSTQLVFTGNGATVELAVPFRVLESNDLTVTMDGDTLVEGVDYTVAGAGPDDGTGTPEGCTIVFLDGPPAPATQITVVRNTDKTQIVTFRPQGTFSPIVYSRIADKLTLLIQELDRRLSKIEVLSDLISIGNVDGAFISGGFEAEDPVENTFPFALEVAQADAIAGIVWHIVVDGDDGAVLEEPPQVQWRVLDTNRIEVVFVSGLTPGATYDITGIAFYAPS